MMVSRAECTDCEAHIDYLSRDKDLRCECGADMEFVGKVGVVTSISNDIRPDAQELVTRWRERGEDLMEDDPQTDFGRGVGKGFSDCSDELEELIEPTPNGAKEER